MELIVICEAVRRGVLKIYCCLVRLLVLQNTLKELLVLVGFKHDEKEV